MIRQRPRPRPPTKAELQKLRDAADAARERVSKYPPEKKAALETQARARINRRVNSLEEALTLPPDTNPGYVVLSEVNDADLFLVYTNVTLRECGFVTGKGLKKNWKSPKMQRVASTFTRIPQGAVRVLCPDEQFLLIYCCPPTSTPITSNPESFAKWP